VIFTYTCSHVLKQSETFHYNTATDTAISGIIGYNAHNFGFKVVV